MANTQTCAPEINIINSNRAVAGQLGGASNFTTPLNYSSVTALRSALSTANAGYYTSAKLDQLSVNDMVFALRNIQDPTTIANYMTNSAA
jgi:hypothetical protein